MPEYVTRVDIQDTFGVQSAAFEPKSVTRITGANGSGKSSIMRAIAHVFAGGLDPTVIRQGAQKSVIRLTLASGTVITKTTAPKKSGGFKSELEITDPDGKAVPAAQSFVNRLSESLAVDPGQILAIDATTKDGARRLADLLQQIMPLQFTPDEVHAAASYRSSVDVPHGSPDASAAEPVAPLDLTGFKKLILEVREARRRVGIERDQTDGTIDQLNKSLPPDDGTDWAKEAEAIEAEKRAAEAQMRSLISDLEKEARGAAAEASAKLTATVQEIDADIEGRIRALEAERAERKGAARGAFDKANGEITRIMAEERNRITDEAKPGLDALTSGVAAAREKAAEQQRAIGVKKQIPVFLQKHRAAAWEYDQLTAVLESLEKLKQRKLDALPIPGLEVSDGMVSVDGVPWVNVNTARRVEVALQLCALRSGEMAFLLLDDAEHLDSETRKVLEEGIIDAGYQLVCAAVSDGPLAIEAAK